VLTVPSAVTAVRLADLVHASRRAPEKFLGYIVPGALHHSIAAIAQPGREPLMGQRVSYPLPPLLDETFIKATSCRTTDLITVSLIVWLKNIAASFLSSQSCAQPKV